jgi:hypothetical protein
MLFFDTDDNGDVDYHWFYIQKHDDANDNVDDYCYSGG